MNRNQTVLASISLKTITLVTLVALGVFASPLASAAAKQVINIGNGVEPKDIDPQMIQGIYEVRIIDQIFEPLVAYNPTTDKLEPGIAERWEKNKDASVWTFYLRKSNWSDGTPVTAKDFVYSWTRLVSPATASEYAQMGFFIKNGEKFTSKEITDPTQLGMKALDDYTLQVTLEQPTSFFLNIVSHPAMMPVPKHAIEKHQAKWTRPENFVGNGAFKPSKWVINQIFTLVRNPAYWNASKVKLEEANYYPVDNINSEEKMFRTGMLDTTWEVPPEKLDSWKKDKTGVFSSYPYLSVYFYRINVKAPSLTDKKVRKALALAIDRQKIVDFVTRGNEMPDLAFTPDGVNGYHPNKAYAKDASGVAEAKKLLIEAGYTKEKPLPPIEILYNTAENHKKIAEAIQQMWKQNLGVEARLINQEWKSYLNGMKTLNYQIARSGWVADYTDPHSFLDLFLSNNPNNQTNWKNAKYDELVKAAGRDTNQKKRFDLYRQAEDILLDEAPVIPVFVRRRNVLKSTKIVGMTPNLSDRFMLKYMSISDRAKAE